MNDSSHYDHVPSVKAFCSYVHIDNETHGSVVDRMVTDVRLLYEAETGQSLDFFLDRESIGWGQNLREAISRSVENASFFVPIISARYFQSEWCRSELLSFYGKTTSLDVPELILPVVVSGKPLLKEDSDDEVVRIIARVLYVDWTHVWQTERGSAPWSFAVTDLTSRLVELHSSVESRLLARVLEDLPTSAKNGEHREDRSATTLTVPQPEQMTSLKMKSEETIRAIRAVVEEFQSLIRDFVTTFGVGTATRGSRDTTTLDEIGANHLARAHHCNSRAREVLEATLDFDADIRSLTRTARRMNREEKSQVVELVEHFRESALESSRHIRDVTTSAGALSGLGEESVGLRAALSPIRAGLQSLRDVAHILGGWVNLDLSSMG